MSLPDPLHDPYDTADLSAVLRPGETALALEHASRPLSGQDRIVAAAPRTDRAPARAGDERRRRSLPSRMLLAAAAAAARMASGPDWDLDVDRALGGTIAWGQPGSLAARLRAAVWGQPVGAIRLLVTDSRLVAVRAGVSVETDERVGRFGLRNVTPYLEELSIELDLVEAAGRRGWFLQRGRLRVEFVDGSALCVLTGMVSTRASSRLEIALLAARREPADA